MNSVYDAMLRIRDVKSSTYPDCRGLLIVCPTVLRDLYEAGKVLVVDGRVYAKVLNGRVAKAD